MSEDNVSYDLNKRFWTQLIYGLTPFSSQRVQGSSLSSIILPNLSLLQLGSNEEDDWYDEKYDLTDFPNATSALVALVSSRAAALRGRGRRLSSWRRLKERRNQRRNKWSFKVWFQRAFLKEDLGMESRNDISFCLSSCWYGMKLKRL